MGSKAKPRAQVTPQVRLAMAELLKRPDVLSVSLGYPVRGGAWKEDEIAIGVHVVSKRDRKELSDEVCIPERICGLPTDVYELDAKLYADKDHLRGIRGPDIIRDGSTHRRYGAITAAMHVEGGTLVLAAGHVVLPQQNGRIARKFVTDPRFRPVHARYIATSGHEYFGSVEEGEFGGDRDWGLVFFTDLSIRQANLFHPNETARFPLRCSESEIFPNHYVYQYPCPWRECGAPSDKPIRGSIAHYLVDHKSLLTADGTSVAYSGLVAIKGMDKPFSCSGDSGSGVYDRYGGLVGMVVGGGTIDSTKSSLHVSLIAPIGSLHQRFRNHARASSFFE